MSFVYIVKKDLNFNLEQAAKLVEEKTSLKLNKLKEKT